MLAFCAYAAAKCGSSLIAASSKPTASRKLSSLWEELADRYCSEIDITRLRVARRPDEQRGGDRCPSRRLSAAATFWAMSLCMAKTSPGGLSKLSDQRSTPFEPSMS